MNGKCLSKAVIYQANVKSSKGCKKYVGLAGGTFKERYYNHVNAFKHRKHKHDTELSKHIWDLKDSKEEYEITWEILLKSNTFRRKSGTCNLCIEEKLAILMSRKVDANQSLNKRSELLNKCRHGNSTTTMKRGKKPPPR